MRDIERRWPAVVGEVSSDARCRLGGQTPRKRIGNEVPQAVGHPSLKFGLERMIVARERLTVHVDVPESWVRPAGLNAAGPRVRKVDWLGLLLIRAFGADVIHLQRRALEELLLNADVPALVVTHSRLQRQRVPVHGSHRRAKWRSEIEIGQGPRRHDVRSRRHAFAQAERNEVEIQAPARAFRFVKDAIAATKHGALAERPPRQTNTRRKLPRVVGRDGERHARLTAGLDQIAKERIANVRHRLSGEIDLIGFARNDD